MGKQNFFPGKIVKQFLWFQIIKNFQDHRHSDELLLSDLTVTNFSRGKNFTVYENKAGIHMALAYLKA